MAVGAFPLAKLGALFVKQLSKPLANKLKTRAKSSPFFRRYVCMPPAQIYHWCEVNIKMRILNLGKPSAVKPLNEREAIELGAELLGEFIIFAVAAGTITAEYLRQARNERAKEEMKEDRYHRWVGCLLWPGGREYPPIGSVQKFVAWLKLLFLAVK